MCCSLKASSVTSNHLVLDDFAIAALHIVFYSIHLFPVTHPSQKLRHSKSHTFASLSLFHFKSNHICWSLHQKNKQICHSVMTYGPHCTVCLPYVVHRLWRSIFAGLCSLALSRLGGSNTVNLKHSFFKKKKKRKKRSPVYFARG